MNHASHTWRNPNHNWMNHQRGQKRHNAARSFRRNGKWTAAQLKKEGK